MIDYARLLLAAQGTMGIVTWASVHCAIKRSRHEIRFAASDELAPVIDFVYRVTRVRFGDEIFLVNAAMLAAMLAKDGADYERMRTGLPAWIAVLGISSGEVLTFISDSASRAMAIQSGDVDVATALTYTDTMGLAGNSAIDMIYGTSTCVKTLWMNTLMEPFGDERVREAVDLLIDKDAINAMATGQHGQVVDSVFAISTPLYSGGTEKHEVNIERAKELLAEAGYADGFTTEMYGTSETRAVMEMIQSCLLKANIQTNISTVDGSSEITKMNEGDYILHCGFAYNYDQYSLLDRFDGRLEISKSGGGSHYQSEEIYEMIDRCRAAIDLAEQQEAFAVLQDFIRAHYIVIPLYTEVGYQAVRAGITGGNFNDLGYINLTTIRPVA